MCMYVMYSSMMIIWTGVCVMNITFLSSHMCGNKDITYDHFFFEVHVKQKRQFVGETSNEMSRKKRQT